MQSWPESEPCGVCPPPAWRNACDEEVVSVTFCFCLFFFFFPLSSVYFTLFLFSCPVEGYEVYAHGWSLCVLSCFLSLSLFSFHSSPFYLLPSCEGVKV